MKYLLDTNVFIQALRRRPPAVAARMVKRIRAINTEDVAVCAIVREELMFGALLSARPGDQAAAMREFLQPFATVAYDDAAADHAARIRADLTRKGTPIGPHDVQIAAISLANNLTLVTHNIAEFGRVEGLRVEDWEEAA